MEGKSSEGKGAEAEGAARRSSGGSKASSRHSAGAGGDGAAAPASARSRGSKGSGGGGGSDNAGGSSGRQETKEKESSDAAVGTGRKGSSGSGSGGGGAPARAAPMADPTKGMSDDDAKRYHAAARIQGLARRRAARNRVRDMVHALFEKAYDESTGAFFYFNTKTGESTWEKPKVLAAEDDVELTPRSKEVASKRGLMLEDGDAASHGASTGAGAGSGAGVGAESARVPKPITMTLDEFLEETALTEYRDALLEDGFTDMEALLAVEDMDLEEIGMKKGHRRKLFRALALAQGMTPRTARTDDSHVGSAAGAGGGGEGGDGAAGPGFHLDFAKAGVGGGKAASRRGSALSHQSAAMHGAGSQRESRLSTGRSEGTGLGTGVKKKAVIVEEEEPPDVMIETTFEGDNAGTPEEGQIVRVHYVGKFLSGKTFESSRARGRAFQFKVGVGQVIEAWDIAIMKMCRGQRGRFLAEPELAYGVEGRPPVIPPNCPLEFEVELIDFFDPDVELTPRSQYDPEIDGTPREDAGSVDGLQGAGGAAIGGMAAEAMGQ